jgi:hypothetical protein
MPSARVLKRDDGKQLGFVVRYYEDEPMCAWTMTGRLGACSSDQAARGNISPDLYGYYTRHGQYVPGAGDRLIYGPGYVFVPGRGILDEACNLPSSTCTNEYRDVR